ncbi:MAG: hypothetical protein JOZ54_02530 [Acidobacteria bacterium]|nr:hypothetical protein [Acidobacteriota bacterium]
MKRAWVLLLCLSGVHGLFAQAVHPNWERGIAAEKAYEFGDLDTVNLFNGNLNVAIPIGQTYHLGGNLSHALVLHYGGNNWEFETAVHNYFGESKAYTWAYPAKLQNAGFGWRLSFGELRNELPCAPGVSGAAAWAYVAPDGGTHCFHPLAHPSETTSTPGIFYSADGSYLRFDQRNSSALKVELPDGTYHVFDNTGRLTDMYDRFNNWVHVAYGLDGLAPIWTITDSAGRTHEVRFKKTASYEEKGGFNVLVEHYSVDRVSLKTFGGLAATYTFHYEGESTGSYSSIPRHPIVEGEPDPYLPGNANVALLTEVDMPENLKWTFDYVRCNSVPEGDCPDSSGSLARLRLPTGGQLEWTYQQFVLPGAWFQSNPLKPVEGQLYTTPVAVATRTMKVGNTILGTRDYTQELIGNLDLEHRVVVTDHADGPGSPVIRSTRSYFSICPNSISCTQFGIGGEYGLPLSRRPESNDQTANGVAVSSEDLGPDSSGHWTLPLRRRYVQYEGDIYLPSLFSGITSDYNRRVVKELTKYEDGKIAATEYSQFDGLGHYRRTETSGTFGARDARVLFTNFNPARGNYKANSNGTYDGSFSPFPLASPWLINMYSYETATELLPAVSSPAVLNTALATARTEACFDATTGFLTGRRMLVNNVNEPNPPTYSPADLLALFTPDARGNIETEKYYGGDENATAFTNCSPPGAPAYSLFHEWSAAGALLKSHYKDGSSDFAEALSQDADASTGFVTATYDASGLGTAFTYDRLGRVLTASPAGNAGDVPRGASTSYAYAVPENAPPTVTISQTSGTTDLPSSTLTFDGFGRLVLQSKTMPGLSPSKVQTDYNSLGWKTRVSESEDVPSHFTTFDYDPFGRPAKVKAPDNSVTTLVYSGVSQTARNVTVRTPTGDQTSTTTEIYDRQGKLWQVVDGENVTTSYTYDVGNRLRSVCMNPDGSTCRQVRTFLYDHRGFLNSESHPEKSTTYSHYDARGHFLRMNDGVKELSFVHDKAERLTNVNETVSTRPLKRLEFATTQPAGKFLIGKVVKAVRHNWIGDDFDFQVIESYEYGGRDGRANKRTTQEKTCAVVAGSPDCRTELAGSGDLVTFETSLVQDPLGNPSTVTYPKCLFAPCSGAVLSSPEVTNAYAKGLLTNVTANGQNNAIAYWNSGLVKSVAHSNNVTDWQDADPNGMRRPAAIRTTGASESAACTAPTFAAQPPPVTNVVAPGAPVPIVAVVNTDSNTTAHPLTIQWYQAASPSMTNPVASVTTGTAGSFETKIEVPTTAGTTTYWVRATNGCGAGANSATATVTICPNVSITAQPTGTSMTSGLSTTLTVGASGSGLQYQWYQGTSGMTTAPIAGATSATLPVTPTQTSSYWARISSSCGASVDSATATVTLTAPPAPIGLVASYQGGAIQLSWSAASPPAGVRSYIIRRRYNSIGYRDYQTVSSSTHAAVDALTDPDTAYIYRVVVVDNNGIRSAESVPDVATTTVFTDDPVSAGVTLVKGIHVSQLRRAIDALRRSASISPFWSSYTAPTGTVPAQHMIDMRSAMGAARSSLGLPAISYTTTNLLAGSPILGSDFQQLRGGVQ